MYVTVISSHSLLLTYTVYVWTEAARGLATFTVDIKMDQESVN